MPIGRPRLDPACARVIFTARVHPDTLRRLHQLKDARKLHLGQLLDQFMLEVQDKDTSHAR